MNGEPHLFAEIVSCPGTSSSSSADSAMESGKDTGGERGKHGSTAHGQEDHDLQKDQM